MRSEDGRKPGGENHPGITSIHFFVDDSATAGAISDPKLQPGQLYGAKFLDEDPTHSVGVPWCPRHCNIEGNDRADELAKEATQLAWSAPISASRAFALRRKASTQSAWIRDWQKAPRTGRFAISNRIPPSLNPTKHFVTLKDRREVLGRLRRPSTMPHRTRVHRRIPQTVLPRGEHQLRVWRGPPNPRIYYKRMHSLREPPSKTTRSCHSSPPL
jgi:hypothetical protein